MPQKRRPRPGIRFHRCELPADERTTHNGIPITTYLQLEHASREVARDVRRLLATATLAA